MAIPSSASARLFYRAAKQRFEDAEFLLDANRTTAAVYLAGYGVECMLNALIVSVVPSSREDDVLVMFRGARAHDFDWLRLQYLERGGPALSAEIVPEFARVNTWSTDMRYSPGTTSMSDARVFLTACVAIYNWADGRLS